MAHQTSKILIWFCLCLFLSGNSNAQDFKTIGYFPYYRLSHIEEIDFTQLTHCNIAFANPDMEGSLSFDDVDITPIITKAHDHDVSVFISLAGGYLRPIWEEAWNHLMKTENRSAFIHKMMNYAKSLEVQGIDVDLEWSYVNELYSPFVLELRDSTLANDLLLSAALPGTYRFPPVSDAVLAE
jgi:GH18 family chitinase